MMTFSSLVNPTDFEKCENYPGSPLRDSLTTDLGLFIGYTFMLKRFRLLPLFMEHGAYHMRRSLREQKTV